MDYVTTKELTELTGAPFYTIRYLHQLNKLPVVRGSTGQGKPILYKPRAIRIVQDHISRPGTNNRVIQKSAIEEAV